MREVVRMGFIGLGGNAQAHITAHKANLRSHVLAVCDLSEERTARVGKRFDVPYQFQDYGIVECQDIDAISIHTPDHLHAEPFVKAIEAGKHVFVEKPMGNSLEDLESMIAAVRRFPEQKVLVGQILRFNPVFSQVKEIIDRGELGELFYLEGDYIHNLRYQASADRFNRDMGMNWYLEREIPMVGGGVHPLDVLRWFVGEPIVEVTGFGNHVAFPEMKSQDCQVALFRFSGGAVAKVACSYGCVSPYAFLNNVVVYGTRGTVSRDKICRESNPEEFQDLGVTYAGLHPYEPEVEHFLDCILNDSGPLIDAFDGANSAAACIVAAEACRGQGASLPVPHYERADDRTER